MGPPRGGGEDVGGLGGRMSKSVREDPSVVEALRRLEGMALERDGLDAQVKALAAMEAQVRGMEGLVAASGDAGGGGGADFRADVDFVKGMAALEAGNLAVAGRHFQGALARFRMTADGSGAVDVQGAANARLMLAQTRLAQGAAARALAVADAAVQDFAVAVPALGGGGGDGAANRAEALRLLDGTLEGMMRASTRGGEALHKAVDGLLGELSARVVRCEALLSLAEEAAPPGDSSQLHGARALEDAEACVMLMGKLPPGPEAGRVWMLLGSAARACGQLEKADTALGEAVKALMRERNGALAVCALHVRAAVAAALEDPEMGGWGVEGQKHLTFAALVAKRFGLKQLEEETQRMVEADPVAAAAAAEDRSRRSAGDATAVAIGVGGNGVGRSDSALAKVEMPTPARKAIDAPEEDAYDALDSLD